MWMEFKAFLIKQNAIALALAVVIGVALDTVVKAIVDGAIMPIVAAVTPDPARWQTLTLDVGPLHFKPGLIIGALINFAIVGFVAWRISRALLKDDPESPTRKCEFCKMDVDAAATRCPHCTSQLAPVAAGGSHPAPAAPSPAPARVE